MVTFENEKRQDGKATGRGRHGMNSESTRAAIRDSAATLFRQRGYHEVTMRQIAGEAGCSHTAIYRYFPDKESLLEAIAIPVLERLAEDIDEITSADSTSGDSPVDTTAEGRLVELCMKFVRFGLSNRSMFRLFFMVHAERVDREPSRSRINTMRNGLFHRLRSALAEVLHLEADHEDTLLAGRGLYYLLHGMIGTYEESEESDEAILDRLDTTFSTAIRSLVKGFRSEIFTKGGTE